MQLIRDILEIFTSLAFAVLAWLTYLSVKASQNSVNEMRITRLAQFRPLIHPKLTLDDEGYRLKLALKNIGQGPALNIKTEVGACQEPLVSLHEDFLARDGETETLLPEDVVAGDNREIRLKTSFCDLFQNAYAIISIYRKTQTPDRKPKLKLLDTWVETRK